jgi:hypothetical protein
MQVWEFRAQGAKSNGEAIRASPGGEERSRAAKYARQPTLVLPVSVPFVLQSLAVLLLRQEIAQTANTTDSIPER